MRLELNNDQVRRDEILFPNSTPEYRGGTEHYEGLTLSGLKKLVEEGFADPFERQNDAYSIGEFIEYFDGSGLDVSFHGYAVTIERDDYRVSVEGFVTVCQHQTQLVASLLFGRFADELNVSDDSMVVYAWWD